MDATEGVPPRRNFCRDRIGQPSGLSLPRRHSFGHQRGGVEVAVEVVAEAWFGIIGGVDEVVLGLVEVVGFVFGEAIKRRRDQWRLP